jgi:hypothetical protein
MAKDTKDGHNQYTGPEDVEKTFKPDSPDTDRKEAGIRNLQIDGYINYVTFCNNYITLIQSDAMIFVVVTFIG